MGGAERSAEGTLELCVFVAEETAIIGRGIKFGEKGQNWRDADDMDGYGADGNCRGRQG